jgi:hypothetical protein
LINARQVRYARIEKRSEKILRQYIGAPEVHFQAYWAATSLAGEKSKQPAAKGRRRLKDGSQS